MPTFRHTPLAPPSCAGDASRLLARVAIARGATTVEEVNEFVAPAPVLVNPWERHAALIRSAHGRLAQAISSGQEILVWADYDVDGITSTVLLVSYLEARGARFHWFIPNRSTDDYGVNLAPARSLFEKYQPKLIVTADCGSNSHEALAFLRTQGCDAIVIDHHPTRCAEPVDGLVHLNPHVIAGSSRDLRNMCAAGLIYWLLQSFTALDGSSFPIALQEEHIVLSGLATVADVVPLTGSNRALVKRSLSLINRSTTRQAMPGLDALLHGQAGREITAWTYAFHVGPILNSAGRIHSAYSSVRLLLARDPSIAAELAATARSINDARKAEQDLIVAEALSDAQALMARPEPPKVIVLARPHWTPGIDGVVASKIRERFHRPTFVFGATSRTDVEPFLQGSGRSIPEYDLGEAVRAAVQAKVAIAGGGHPAAAGVRVPMDGIAGFAQYLNANCKLPPESFTPSFETIPGSPRMTERDWVSFFAALEPFGAGNIRPLVIVDRMVIVTPPRTIHAKSQHPLDVRGARPTGFPRFTLVVMESGDGLHRITARYYGDRRDLPRCSHDRKESFTALLRLKAGARKAPCAHNREFRSSTHWVLENFFSTPLTR